MRRTKCVLFTLALLILCGCHGYPTSQIQDDQVTGATPGNLARLNTEDVKLGLSSTNSPAGGIMDPNNINYLGSVPHNMLTLSPQGILSGNPAATHIEGLVGTFEVVQNPDGSHTSVPKSISLDYYTTDTAEIIRAEGESRAKMVDWFKAATAAEAEVAIKMADTVGGVVGDMVKMAARAAGVPVP